MTDNAAAAEETPVSDEILSSLSAPEGAQSPALSGDAASPTSAGGSAEAAPSETEAPHETTAKLSLTELSAGWKEMEEKKPELCTTLSFGAKTNLGRIRENNEDKFDFFVPEQPHILAARGRLYAVADGMGGHAAGQIASEYALNVLIREYYWDTSSELEIALRTAIERANLLINEAANAMPERNQMGTTLTCAVVREDDLYVGQVGDSRAYLLREGALRQITEDHSWVAEQVKRGAMTSEEAECSPFRNLITRSLGTMPDVEADLFHENLLEGDTVLLCSDGLSGMLSDHEITEILSGRSPSLATLTLVERANEAGGRDNITAVVLQVTAIEPYEKKKGFRWPRPQKPTRR